MTPAPDSQAAAQFVFTWSGLAASFWSFLSLQHCIPIFVTYLNFFCFFLAQPQTPWLFDEIGHSPCTASHVRKVAAGCRRFPLSFWCNQIRGVFFFYHHGLKQFILLPCVHCAPLRQMIICCHQYFMILWPPLHLVRCSIVVFGLIWRLTWTGCDHHPNLLLFGAAAQGL